METLCVGFGCVVVAAILMLVLGSFLISIFSDRKTGEFNIISGLCGLASCGVFLGVCYVVGLLVKHYGG